MIAYVALGGLAGTVTRYALGGWIQGSASGRFPVGTLAVNIVGSVALGFLMRYSTGTTLVSPEVRAGLTIGFCGAFTTMSTFSYESVRLTGDGQYAAAALYVALTIAGCFAGVVLGTALANRLL